MIIIYTMMIITKPRLFNRGHHAAAAQLLPWLEQFEVTVDVSPRQNGLGKAPGTVSATEMETQRCEKCGF